jgi:hypothetical protein
MEDVAQLIQAIGMAARGMSSEDANPMLVLVDVTAGKLIRAVIGRISAVRGNLTET